MIKIREIKESDAKQFIALCKSIDNETRFMLFEPDERKTIEEEQTQHIKDVLSKDNQMIFIAEDNEMIVGFLSGIGGVNARTKHRVYIVIGILEDFTSKGIGSMLFEELENWGKKHGAHRLELFVMVNNEKGIGLYKKRGFEVEGLKKDSMRVDGKYIDEYFMAKLI